MKLNYDCVRSVLLSLEQAIQIDDDMRIVPVNVASLFEMVSAYENQDILYSVEKLSEAGYITASFQYAGGCFTDGFVSAIIYSGHEFLESVRNCKRWGKVKSVLVKLGAISLPIICETAKELVMSDIKNSVG